MNFAPNLTRETVKPPKAEGSISVLDPLELGKVFGLGGFDLELKLEVPSVPVVGHMNLTELSLVVGIVKAANATSFFEIGTFDGLTVNNILLNCPALDKIVTVDLPEPFHTDHGRGTVYNIDAPNASMLDTTIIGWRFADHHNCAKIVTQLRIDSAELSPGQFPSSFDVVLIDGSHTYNYCRNDGVFAQTIVSKPGILLFHDYGKLNALPGVTHYLLELAQHGTAHIYRLKVGDVETSLVMCLVLAERE